MKKTKNILYCALMVSITAILSQFIIPLPPVPISLSWIAVYLTGVLLEKKMAFWTQTAFLLLGAVGAPVFSGFSGGLAKLAGPTGGYLIVYPFMAFIIAFIVDKWGHSCLKYGAAMIVASLVGYAGGTAWLAVSGHISFQAALAAGVLPFVWGDLLKVIFTSVFAGALQKALSHAGLLSVNTAQK